MAIQQHTLRRSQQVALAEQLGVHERVDDALAEVEELNARAAGAEPDEDRPHPDPVARAVHADHHDPGVRAHRRRARPGAQHRGRARARHRGGSGLGEADGSATRRRTRDSASACSSRDGSWPRTAAGSPTESGPAAVACSRWCSRRCPRPSTSGDAAALSSGRAAVDRPRRAGRGLREGLHLGGDGHRFGVVRVRAKVGGGDADRDRQQGKRCISPRRFVTST